MPLTKTKHKRAKPAEKALPEVITLAEAAKFLRLPAKAVERLATERNLPGRKIGSEWRFLRRAVEEWLELKGTNGSDILSQFGALKDDPNHERFEESIRKYREQLDAELQ
jgi:excisionase family DNA binding protein